MKSFFLSLGSNVEPEKNVPACLELIRKNFQVKGISSIYKTSPVGPAGKDPFWNAAIWIETDLEEKQLCEKLRAIEECLGRQRSGNKFAPRTMDLDILPQPGYQKRTFIMIPLAEVAPKELDCETGETFEALAGRFASDEKQSVLRVRKRSPNDI